MKKKKIPQLKHEIDTPALIIDLDLFEKNLKLMSNFCKEKNIGLRPHVKSHKTPEIAKLQIASGACGITCAKLSEAEEMAKAGIGDILVSNQIVGEQKIRRLIELARKTNITVSVDSEENIGEISKIASSNGINVNLVIELDVGQNRCGVGSKEAALSLAQKIEKSKFVTLVGLQGFAGHVCLIKNYAERKERYKDSMLFFIETKEAFYKSGLCTDVLTGGGTGTYNIGPLIPGIKELQAGSYVLLDTTYRNLENLEFECALSLLTTVISVRDNERAIVDVGTKGISTDHGVPLVKYFEEIPFEIVGDEYGRLDLSKSSEKFKINDKIEVIPSHVCTTMNLHREVYGVRREKVETVWSISASGRYN